MIPFVEKYLLKNWSSFELGRQPKALIFTKFADRGIRATQVGVVSFLVKGVYPHLEKPLLIVRIPRYPQNQQACLSLENETKNLLLISSKLSGAKVPKVVFFEKINSSPVLGISYLAGSPLSQRILSKNILKDYVGNFGLAFSWLIGFQKGFGAGEAVLLNDLIDQVIRDYVQVFPQNGSERRNYFGKIKLAAEQFKEVKISLFPQHGDFHTDNIFTQAGQISGVVDWEDFSDAGIPGFDVFHFIRTYFEALFDYFTKALDIKAIKALAQGPDSLAVVAATLKNYCQSIALSPELEKILIPLYLVQSATIAGSAHKQATRALKRLEVLLKLEIMGVADLVSQMSVLNYGDLYKTALANKDEQLANLCREEIKKISLKGSR
ncbi:MAG: aminoglycoside phosphotransferase family protein [bacterium]